MKTHLIENTVIKNGINADPNNVGIIYGDSIKIEGFVEIINGDTHIKAKNKFVQTLLQHIMNFISGYQAIGTPSTNLNGPFGGGYYKIYLGSNMSTITGYNTTVLSSPIGTSPGTPPNTISGNVINPSNGVFKIIITATWNPGSISGTVGEMALYLNIFPAGNLRAFRWSGDYTTSAGTLASRISVADGDFSSFSIVTSNALTITWTIQLSFS